MTVTRAKVKSKTSSSGSYIHDDDPWIICSENLVEPQDKFKNIPFVPEILSNLEKENFETTLPLQRWSIPFIRRGENVVMIAPSKQGKTLSYILPIIDSAVEEEKLEEGQVFAIIITSSAENVRFVHSMCRTFLNSKSIEEKLKILAVHEENVNYIKAASCHLLISTENVFIDFMKKSEFNLQKLNFLVFDDAHIMPNPMPMVELILKKMGYKLIKKQCTMVVACRHWTREIYDIVDKVQKKFLYLISSNIELAVFNQIKCSVLYMQENEPKDDILLSKLRKVVHKNKVLIMCKEKTEIYPLIEFITTVATIPLVVHDGISRKSLSESEISWNFPRDNSLPVLLCTFDKFNDIKLEDTDVLIYYSLPSSFEEFNETLACFKRNFKNSSHPKVQKEVGEESSFIILVDQFNDTLPKILDVAERLGAKIPEELWQDYNENSAHSTSNKENKKDSIILCPKFLEIGECPEPRICPHRHVFNSDLDIVKFPINGEIVFKIVHVENFNCFWARLFELEDISTGSMQRLQNKSTDINFQLSMFYKSEKNRMQIKSIKLGLLCGIEGDSGLYYRAQIVKYNEKNIFEVVVRRLERGDLITVKTDELYELPAEVASYPPQILRIALCDLRPISRKTEETAVRFINDLMSKSEKEDQIWSGQIAFSINDTILLEEIKIQSIEDLVINEIFIRKYFIKKKLAVENQGHLSNLYRFANEAGIFNKKSKVKRNELIDVESTTKMKKEPVVEDRRKSEEKPVAENLEPDWAKFKDPFTQVQFLKADSTKLIFVRQSKYKKKLKMLESECQEEGERNKNVGDGSTLRNGDYCLAKAKPSRRWRRARIESRTQEGIDVFFLDYADNQYVQPKDVIPIPGSLLRKLPIQAIECSLIGIKHSNDYGIQVINEIYNFSSGAKDELIVQKINDNLKPKILNGQKFDVNLLSLDGKSLNKQLIDINLVKPLKSELCFVKDSNDILVEDKSSS